MITGRACTRILSGYQKSKAEETRILESLRDEGLLAKPKGKTAGGVSFEVVDADLVQKTQNETENDAFVTAKFIPPKTLSRLESRRGVSKKFHFCCILTQNELKVIEGLVTLIRLPCSNDS